MTQLISAGILTENCHQSLKGYDMSHSINRKEQATGN